MTYALNTCAHRGLDVLCVADRHEQAGAAHSAFAKLAPGISALVLPAASSSSRYTKAHPGGLVRRRRIRRGVDRGCGADDERRLAPWKRLTCPLVVVSGRLPKNPRVSFTSSTAAHISAPHLRVRAPCTWTELPASDWSTHEGE
jgi:hypothetical protein